MSSRTRPGFSRQGGKTLRKTTTGCADAARLSVFRAFVVVWCALAVTFWPASGEAASPISTPGTEQGGAVLETASSAKASPVAAAATAYCVLDTVTGRVLSERNADQRRAPASTTKIMTALVVLEKADLEAKIKVSPKAASTRGSSMWLAAGEELTVRDLLYGLLLNSGNDAAVALAEGVGGSVESFAAFMNEKARELGATSSQFKNPHGLDENGHYSTARDLAVIARAAMANPEFAAIVATRRKVVPWNGHAEDRALHSHNKFLWSYEGATGVKTGYTGQAGKCLVASASRGGWSVIAAVLNSSRMYTDAQVLLDTAYQGYQVTTLVHKGDVVGTVRVERGGEDRVKLVAARDLVLPLNAAEQAALQREEKVPAYVTAPVSAGAVLGSVSASLNGEVLGSLEVVAAEDVRAATVLELFVDRLRGLFSSMLSTLTVYRRG